MKKRVLALSAALAIATFSGCDNPLEETTNSLKELTNVNATVIEGTWAMIHDGMDELTPEANGYLDAEFMKVSGNVITNYFCESVVQNGTIDDFKDDSYSFSVDGAELKIAGQSVPFTVSGDTLSLVYSFGGATAVEQYVKYSGAMPPKSWIGDTSDNGSGNGDGDGDNNNTDPYAWSYGLWGGMMDMSELGDIGVGMPDIYLGLELNKDGSALFIEAVTMYGKTEVDTSISTYTINDSQIIVDDTMIADYEFKNDTLYFTPQEDEMTMTIAMVKGYSPEDAGYVKTEGGKTGSLVVADLTNNLFFEEDETGWNFYEDNTLFIADAEFTNMEFCEWEFSNGVLIVTGQREAIYNTKWENGEVVFEDVESGEVMVLEAWPLN